MTVAETYQRVHANRRLLADCLRTNQVNGWISTPCLYRAEIALVEMLEDECRLAADMDLDLDQSDRMEG